MLCSAEPYNRFYTTSRPIIMAYILIFRGGCVGKLLVGLQCQGRNICYLGGGGAIEKNVRTKSLLKMWAEKKFVVEINEKYIDQKKPPNCNGHKREGIRQKNIFSSSTKIEKKLSDVYRRKKIVFLQR